MLNKTRQLKPSWELVRPSVELVKANYEAIIIIVLLPALLLEFGSQISTSRIWVGVIALLVAGVWRLVNLPVTYYLQYRAASGKTPSLAECYQRGLRYWPRVVGFEIWFALIVIIGIILLIVPGLIIFRRYYFSPFYIVSKNMTIADAMAASRADTTQESAWVWGTFGVMIAFALLAAIVTIIRYIGPILGTLVSLIYFFGPALRWREISKKG